MPTLLEVQRAMRAAILDGDDRAVARHVIADGIAAADRLRIYRNTARHGMTQALRLAFPAVDRLVGGDFFDGAAAAFIAGAPPGSACLDDYGAGFADFLADFPPARTLPYLADVARYEWALSVAAHAPDWPALDAAALAAVPPDAHATLRLAAHPSVSHLALAWPADAIADAVLSGDAAAIAAVDLDDGPVWIVVHRGPDGLESRRLDGNAWAFSARLCAGAPIGALLEGGGAAVAAPVIADHLARGRLAAQMLS